MKKYQNELEVPLIIGAFTEAKDSKHRKDDLIHIITSVFFVFKKDSFLYKINIVDTTSTKNLNENSNYSSLDVIQPNTEINLTSSNINLELDINTIFINSPLEVNSQTVYDILNSILILNGCSFFLTIIIFITFLQYLDSSQGYELNFLLHLPFGKKIQTILKKAIKFGSRNLLIYLFIFWCFIFIFNFTSFVYMAFFVDHLDDLIKIYLNK